MWMRVLGLVDSSGPVAVQCHITSCFCDIKHQCTWMSQVFFFSSLLGQTRCCEVKREFPEERSFIGENHTLSVPAVLYTDKKDERGDTDRPEADAQMDKDKMKHSLFLIRIVGWALEPMSVDLSKAQYTLDGSPGSDVKGLFDENMQISGHLWIEATSALLCHLTPSLKTTQSHCFFSETIHQGRYNPGNDVTLPGQVCKM